MKDKFAGSWEVQELPLSEQFFVYSRAYLDGARAITCDLVKSGAATDFVGGAPAVYLARHALELFLKGALLLANREMGGIHSLEKLSQAFKSAYPDYEWEIPFRTQIVGTTGEEAERALREHEKIQPGDQFPRYPANRDFQPWPSVAAFNGAHFAVDIHRLQADFERFLVTYNVC